MSIKLAILQDQDQVIAEIKEVVDDGKPIGYLFANAHRILQLKDNFLLRVMMIDKFKSLYLLGFYYLLIKKY